MRRTVSLLALSLIAPLMAVAGSTPATAAPSPRTPAVKKAHRAYGSGPVRLEAHQGGDISFRARRGDHVTLQVRGDARAHRTARCLGAVSVVDGRGIVSTRQLTKVFKVHTNGLATLRFRGRCEWQESVPVRLQLVKVRMKRVRSEGQRVRVAAPRQGYLDVAFVRVSGAGRDTLVLRKTDGSVQHSYDSQILVGSRLEADTWTHGVSVEAGHRYTVNPSHQPFVPKQKQGQIVGVVATSAGYASALRAREYRIALDDPALTLAIDRDREYVLSYVDKPEDLSYVLPTDSATVDSWQFYSGGGDPDDPSRHRTIVASDPDGALVQSFSVRVRRTVRVPDLVVGGPPVTFASTDPGTQFIATIPASAAGDVRLTASQVSGQGGWGSHVPPVVCHRDCEWPGTAVSSDNLEADLWLAATEPHELHFGFNWDATGSVTLSLTDIPESD